MNAQEVVKHLKMRFGGEQFAFLEQVADSTGARQRRWADAVAMSVWPSRGYDIHGIEVKVSRYDFLSELKDPEKSAAVQQYCNRWWVATPDESIIQKGEIPPTWGWMVTNGKGGMRVVVEAPPLSPKPISIEFLASVLRNTQKADAAEIERRIYKAKKEAHQEGVEYQKRQYVDLKTKVDAFCAASGIDLSRAWDAGKIGDAVEILRSLHYKTDQITSGIKACDDIRAMLDKVQTFAMLKSEVSA
jgi:hypothetical protein